MKTYTHCNEHNLHFLCHMLTAIKELQFHHFAPHQSVLPLGGASYVLLYIFAKLLHGALRRVSHRSRGQAGAPVRGFGTCGCDTRMSNIHHRIVPFN